MGKGGKEERRKKKRGVRERSKGGKKEKEGQKKQSTGWEREMNKEFLRAVKLPSSELSHFSGDHE